MKWEGDGEITHGVHDHAGDLRRNWVVGDSIHDLLACFVGQEAQQIAVHLEKVSAMSPAVV